MLRSATVHHCGTGTCSSENVVVSAQPVGDLDQRMRSEHLDVGDEAGFRSAGPRNDDPLDPAGAGGLHGRQHSVGGAQLTVPPEITEHQISRHAPVVRA